MKRIIQTGYILLTVGLALLLTSCTKLDVPVLSQLTPGNFPTTPAEYIAASGPAYTQ